MIDQHFEQQLQSWLRDDAAGFAAPAALRRRVLEIPANPPARQPWWTMRFSLAAAPLVTAVVAAAVIASSVFNVFDRPAGADGGLCSNRQVQSALDALRDAPGYRYVAHEELYDFDVEAEFSFEDPQFAWRTGLVAEGAYRSPDRVREIVVEANGFDRGYVEHLQVGDTTWRRPSGADDEAWLRMPNPLPFANMVYGYVLGAFPTFQIPGVTSLDWGGTPAPEDIPGTGGCTVATLIPGDGIGDIVALRIEVGSGRPIGVYRGPPTDADVRHGAIRYLFALAFETPEEAEFTPPTDAIDAPAEGGGEVPPPTDVPARTPPPDAWQPEELPLPDGWSSGMVAAVESIGDGGLVAVGAADRVSADGSFASEAVVWTSVDGVSWEIVSDGPAADRLSGLGWDGETLLATGNRAASRDTVESQVWSSPDGRDWEMAATLGVEVMPGQPVSTTHGWVMPATRSSESAEAGGGFQSTPTILHSTDGREWQERVLPDTGSGSLSSVVELPSGTLLAFGCESPGATNSTQFGEMCLTRPWRSDDGITWQPGPVLDVAVGGVVTDGDDLLGIGSQGEPGRPGPNRLYRSDDGETWTPDPFDFGATWDPSEPWMGGGPERVVVIDDTIVVEGSGTGFTPSGRPYPALWLMTTDGTWEEVAVGFTEDGGYIEDVLAVNGRLVLVGFLAEGEMGSRPVVWLEPQG